MILLLKVVINEIALSAESLVVERVFKDDSAALYSAVVSQSGLERKSGSISRRSNRSRDLGPTKLLRVESSDTEGNVGFLISSSSLVTAADISFAS